MDNPDSNPDLYFKAFFVLEAWTNKKRKKVWTMKEMCDKRPFS